MKKLMTMIAAVATAFGLYAADPVVTGNASFEATTEAGVSADEFDAAGEAAKAAGWSWAGDPLKLGAYNGDAYGYQGAGNTRRSEFEGYPNQAKYLKLETTKDQVLSRTITGASIFVDQLVQFTGFEDAPVFTDDDDTKIAVWMEEAVISEEPEVTATNLWITAGAGKVQVQIGATNEYQLGKWYRLTIKSLGVIDGDDTVGFIVYIDGQQVGSWMDEAKTLINPSVLSEANQALLAEGKLFPAMNAGAIEAVGYNGIGAIDDLTIDDQGPQFARFVDVTAAQLAITGMKVVKIDGVDVSGEGPWSVKPGNITVTYERDGAYVVKGTPTAIWAVSASGATLKEQGFTATEADVMLTRNSVDTYYLQEDFEAMLAGVPPAVVKDGDVITVLKAIDKEDEGEPVYSFTAGTTITIQDVKEESTVVAVKWIVNIPDVDEKTAGALIFNLGLAAEKQIEVTFTGANAADGWVTFSGEIAEGASFTQTNGAGGEGTIKLMSETSVVTVPADAEFEVTADEGLVLNTDTTTKEGFVIYTAEPEPTTFTVTVDNANEHSTIVVKSNDTVIAYAPSYTLPDDGTVLAVTYNADQGYKLIGEEGARVDTVGYNLTEDGDEATAPDVEAITYQVTYADGGADGGTSVAAQDYTLETKDLKAAVNTWTKTNCEFAGWTNSVAGGAIIAEGEALEPVVGGIALTAVWTEKQAEPDPTETDPDDPKIADKKAYEVFKSLPDAVKNTGIMASDLARWCQGAALGTVTAGGANIDLDAYKLDCPNTPEAVLAAKANFKFTAEDLAQVMADPTKLETLNEQSINGTLVITKWADPAFTVEYTDGAACFYKAEVTVPAKE